MFTSGRVSKIWQSVLDNFFRHEDKLLPSWLVRVKRKYWEFRDYQLGREHKGMDKYGNEYYQYYSYFGGLPTHRIVIYKFYNSQHFHNDPHFIGWLEHRVDKLPTPAELQYLYLQDAQFKRKGVAWDMEQKKLLEDRKTMRKELEDREKQRVESIANAEDSLNVGRKVYAYIDETKPKKVMQMTQVQAEEQKEDEIDLKVLKEIIGEEERKIESYREKREVTSLYIRKAIKDFNRYDKFKETFKDVFLELEMQDSKSKYALVESDPDIRYTLRNHT